jgi:hypothetical protein
MRVLTIVALGLVFALSAALLKPASADGIDSQSLATDMLGEMLRHKMRSFDQSALNGYFVRASIAGGAAEKIANLVWEQNGDRLGFMLTESGLPSSVSDNPYVELTKNLSGGSSKELALAEKIMASGGNLAPGDVLGMALDVCSGDYWLATLTAHNMLKEITYAERSGHQPVLGWNGANTDDATKFRIVRAGDVTGKLANLRPTGDQFIKDKMGPWYHLYGLLFIGGMASGNEADYLAWMENMTRKLHLGSDPDRFKEDMNTWAANLSHAMNQWVAEGIYVPADLQQLSKEELQSVFDKLRAKHRALQGELEALAGLVNSADLGDYAEWRMDVVRSLQQSLYNEALRVREEQNKRK